MFNSLLKEAGDFGLYQRLVTFGFLLVTMTLMTFALWSQLFILMRPRHRCKIHPDDNFWLWNNMTDETGIVAEQCRLLIPLSPSSNSTDAAINATDNYKAVSCPYGWVYDFSEMNPTFATEQDLVCNDSWKLYSIHTAFYFAAFIGALLAGWCADKYGRKRTFQFCLVLAIVSDLATIFAPNVTTFTAARFFSSVGSANITTIGFLLALEYTGPSYRLCNLGVWTFTFTFTSTGLPWLVYILPQWRYFLGVVFIPYILALITSCFVLESSSWLITCGRTEEAAEALYRVAKINGKDMTLDYIKSKLSEESATDLQKNTKDGVDSVDKQNTKSGNAILAIFRSPRLRKRMIILIVLWMTASMCYVGCNLETGNLPFPWYMSYSLGGIAELPAGLINIFLLDKLGRKWTNLSFFTLGGILGIVAGKFLKNPIAVLAVSTAMRLCYAASFDITFTYSNESIPTVVRGRIILLIRAFGAIATAIAPFVVYISEIDKLLPLTVLGTIALTFGVLNLFLPETAQQHLPHTVEEGENFGIGQPFFYIPYLHANDKICAVEDSEKNKDSEDKL